MQIQEKVLLISRTRISFNKFLLKILDHVCNLSMAYQQCSDSMTINHHLQDPYNVTPQSNSSSTESNLGMLH